MAANWGYSDHGLLTWLVVVATVVAAMSMVYRFFACQGRLASSEGVDAYHAAFLAGGPQLAVYAALGELRRGDAVGATPDGLLTPLTPPPMEATGLLRSVHEATVSGSLIAVQLRDHPTVEAALTAIRSGLQDGGLLLTLAQRSRNRWFVYAQLVVMAIVAVRVAVDLCFGAPIDELWRGIVLMGLYLAFMVMVPRAPEPAPLGSPNCDVTTPNSHRHDWSSNSGSSERFWRTDGDGIRRLGRRWIPPARLRWRICLVWSRCMRWTRHLPRTSALPVDDLSTTFCEPSPMSNARSSSHLGDVAFDLLDLDDSPASKSPSKNSPTTARDRHASPKGEPVASSRSMRGPP